MSCQPLNLNQDIQKHNMLPTSPIHAQGDLRLIYSSRMLFNEEIGLKTFCLSNDHFSTSNGKSNLNNEQA